MALNWLWSEKCGEVKYGDHSVNLYEGNAFMIMIAEWTTEDGTEQYTVSGFFLDKEHAKRCLGLAKGSSNIFERYPWTKLTLYRGKSRNWKALTELAAKAFPGIEIHVLP